MKDEDLLIRFGNRLRELRLQKKISQEQLANLAGLHRTYIGMIERAEKNISLVNIGKLSKALNIKLELFFQDVDS